MVLQEISPQLNTSANGRDKECHAALRERSLNGTVNFSIENLQKALANKEFDQASECQHPNAGNQIYLGKENTPITELSSHRSAISGIISENLGIGNFALQNLNPNSYNTGNIHLTSIQPKDSISEFQTS